MKRSVKRVGASVAGSVAAVVLTTPISTVAANAADTPELECNNHISSSCPVFGGITVGYSATQPAPAAQWGKPIVKVKGDNVATAEPGEKVQFTYEVTVPLQRDGGTDGAKKVSFDLWQQGALTSSYNNKVTGAIVDKGTPVPGSSQTSFETLGECSPNVVVPADGTHVTLTCDVPAEGAYYFVPYRTGDYGSENHGHWRLDSQERPAPAEATDAETADPKVSATVPEGYEVTEVTGARDGDTWKGTFVVTVPAAPEVDTENSVTPDVTANDMPAENVPDVTVYTVEAEDGEGGEGTETGESGEGTETGETGEGTTNPDEDKDKDKDNNPVLPGITIPSEDDNSSEGEGESEDNKDNKDDKDDKSGSESKESSESTDESKQESKESSESKKSEESGKQEATQQSAKPGQANQSLAVTGASTGLFALLALSLAAGGAVVATRSRKA